MINIKTNIENEEYLDIDAKFVLTKLTLEETIPININVLAKIMYMDLLSFERKNNTGYIKEISIKKDSFLGEYLLNTKDIDVINLDKIITPSKVSNALNIALLSENPIYNKLIPIFENKVEGNYDDLINIYDKELLDYIVKNNNLKNYLEKIDGFYEPSIYVIYDDDKYKIGKLVEENYQKVNS